MIQGTNHTTRSSYQQQQAMMRFLGEKLGASVNYDARDEYDRTVATVTLPDGETAQFNVYGGKP